MVTRLAPLQEDLAQEMQTFFADGIDTYSIRIAGLWNRRTVYPSRSDGSF